MFTRSRIVCIALLWPALVLATQFGDIPVTQVIGTPTITNDANVTLTLGGTPTDAILKPFSLTLGWTGTLSIGRGGTGASTAATALSNLGGEPTLGNPSVDGYLLSSTAAGVRSWVVPPSGGGGAVSSVFGRTGAVVAATGDYTAAQVTNAVSTLGSYSNPSWITALAWSKITGTPTSLSGYGITDPVVLTSGSYADPAWITSLGWSKITGAPSFESPLTFQQSLTRSSNTVNLVGDSTSPGNSMLYGTNSSGTKGWYAQPSGGSGTVTNIATTSPITGGPITTTGTIGLNVGVDHAFTAAQTMTVNDAVTNVITDILTLSHDTTGLAAASFGTGIMFKGETTTTADTIMGEVGAIWADATHASRKSELVFKAANTSGLGTTNYWRLFPSGYLTNGTNTDLGVGAVNAAGGFTVNDATATTGKFLEGDGTSYKGSAYSVPTTLGSTGTFWQSNGTNIAVSSWTMPNTVPTTGKILISDGTNMVGSTPTFPNSAASSGKILIGTGTNWAISTPTYPAAAGTAGNVITSDGTNFTSAAPATVTGQWDSILKVSGSDFTTTNLTATTITGLQTPTLSLSTLYEFEITLAVASSDTNGLKVAVTGSGAAYTRLVYTGEGTQSATLANVFGGLTGDSLNNTALCTLAGDGFVSIHGFMLTAASGSPTIIARIAKVTSGTATVYIGSQLKYRKI